MRGWILLAAVVLVLAALISLNGAASDPADEPDVSTSARPAGPPAEPESGARRAVATGVGTDGTEDDVHQIPAGDTNAQSYTAEQRRALATARAWGAKYRFPMPEPAHYSPTALDAILQAYQQCEATLEQIEIVRGPAVLELAKQKQAQGHYQEFPHPSSVPAAERAVLREKLEIAKRQRLDEEISIISTSKWTRVVRIPAGESQLLDDLRHKAQSAIVSYLSTVKSAAG